jgi:hypothetical protein
MFLLLNAYSYNSYIKNNLQNFDEKHTKRIIPLQFPNPAIRKQIYALEKRYRNNKIKHEKFPTKNTDLLFVYMNMYALMNIHNKAAILELETRYYESLYEKVLRNEITEEKYRMVGDAIKTTNDITKSFEELSDDFNATFDTSDNDICIKFES